MASSLDNESAKGGKQQGKHEWSLVVGTKSKGRRSNNHGPRHQKQQHKKRDRERERERELQALKTNSAVVNGGGDLTTFKLDDACFITPRTTKTKCFGEGSAPQTQRRGSSNGKRSSQRSSLSSRKLDIWNSLMNNLSRAIDDVYFMSEIECSAEQVEIVRKVISNSLKDFESLASSIESQKHFEKEREEARNGEKKRMTVAWDVKKTIKVSPKHLELLSTLEKSDESASSDHSLDSETSFEDFLHNSRETNENNCEEDLRANSNSKAKMARERSHSVEKDGLSNSAWREERNWGDIFANRARDLQAKLLSPERQKLTPLEAKKKAEEKQARASLFRKKKSRALAERLAKADETRQAIRSQQADELEKKIQDMDQKIQRGRQLRDKHLAAIAGKAKSENMKVNEVVSLTSLEAEDKRSALNQRMQETEARRKEILAAVVERQRQTDAAIEEAQKRKQKLEEERLKLLAEEQQRKEQIQLKFQQERQLAAEAREALAEQRRMAAEENQRVQEKEAELKRKKIVDRLEEARTRRTLYLVQIKEKASLNKQDGERRDSGAFTSSPYLLSPAKDKRMPESPRIGENRESEYLQRYLEEFTNKIQTFR